MSNETKAEWYPPATAEYTEVAQNADLFFQTLHSFHSSFSSKFTVPIIGGKVLDLHRLFWEVTSRGGLEKVIRDRRWKEISLAFNFPPTITSVSFVLRKYYLSLLLHYEQVYYFRNQGPSILAAADPVSRSHVNGSDTLRAVAEDATLDQLPEIPQVGCSVSGTIDAKFDNGYLVTVDLGSHKIQGVLYHIPHMYSVLKPSDSGKENTISKKIGLLWNEQTDAEKQLSIQVTEGKRSKDLGWEHGDPLANSKNGSICRYCGKVIMSGGVTRLKEHLSGSNKKNVTQCPNVPPEVVSEIRVALISKAKIKGVAHEEEEVRSSTDDSLDGFIREDDDDYDDDNIRVAGLDRHYMSGGQQIL